MHDVAVVGGGIIGLATAYSLLQSRPDLSVAVVEKEKVLAGHQTGHNSGIIHSGIYYLPGSLKAKMARSGSRALIEFCRQHEIPYRITGKLIVATRQSELSQLEKLAHQAALNRITVRRLDYSEVHYYEPHVRGLSGLWVTDTGICRYRRVAQKIAASIEQQGSDIFLATKVIGVRTLADSLVLKTEGDEIRARCVVNCAGLQADRLAKKLSGDKELPIKIVPFRGEYFRLNSRAQKLVRGLVYPVPDPALPFLGIHANRDLTNTVHIGPNALVAGDREGYRRWGIRFRDAADLLTYSGFWKLAGRYWLEGSAELAHALSKKSFAAAAQRLIPDMQADDLEWAGSGIRAQAVSRSGELVDDFLIKEQERQVHVLNAPSPAATACFPIGAEIARRVFSQLA